MSDKNEKNLLLRLRQEKGWTKNELAHILSVSEKTLSKWENGNGFPNLETFELLMQVSGESFSKLLSEEDQEGKMLSEAIAIYKSKMKTKNRIIIILFGTLIVTVVFLLDSMGFTGFMFLCFPVLLCILGILLIFIGQQLKREKNKSLWIFILGGCFLASPLLFYILLFIIVPVVYGGPVPT